MSDGPEWFAPKRYGIGTAVPITWQGWAVTIGYLIVVVGVCLSLKDRLLEMIALLVPVTVLFMVISAKTTRGGWRWHWGDRDEG